MLPSNLGNIEEGKKITEQELDALYLYLDMNLDEMSDEDKTFWLELLKRLDVEFYDNTSDGADDLQDVQSPERSA